MCNLMLSVYLAMALLHTCGTLCACTSVCVCILCLHEGTYMCLSVLCMLNIRGWEVGSGEREGGMHVVSSCTAMKQSFQ